MRVPIDGSGVASAERSRGLGRSNARSERSAQDAGGEALITTPRYDSRRPRRERGTGAWCGRRSPCPTALQRCRYALRRPVGARIIDRRFCADEKDPEVRRLTVRDGRRRSADLKRICGEARDDEAQELKTLAHELTHAIVHEHATDRPLCELEAESVAFNLVQALDQLRTAAHSDMWPDGLTAGTRPSRRQDVGCRDPDHREREPRGRAARWSRWQAA